LPGHSHDLSDRSCQRHERREECATERGH
jgi:hypothetical protein